MITEFYMIVNPKTNLIEDFLFIKEGSGIVIDNSLNLRYTGFHCFLYNQSFGKYLKNYNVSMVKL